MTQIIEFETERLRLRQWLSTDREAFAALNADSRVMEFLLPLSTATESDALMNKIQALIAARGWGFWALEERATGAFIGFTGLHIPMAELPFSPCVEIGWRLAFAHWGKGYATEAAAGALAFGFEHLRLSEIVAFTALPNLRSQAVMQRLAMEREPATFAHPAVPDGSLIKEHYLYRIKRNAWLRSNNRAQ
ncbi:MAG TPA: GNAT family N-acetyltransferase [Cellvibrio sp.]|nr:GNAT family N-acetyltransferase [Cellvibrio sp.]